METLQIKNLSKTYSNGVQALQDVSLDIPSGLFGLLGPNGAGKSSLMRTIATLQDADEGEVIWGHINILENKKTVREKLGYLPQEFGVYPKVSAEALLHHLAVLKGITNRGERRSIVEALLNKTNLYNHRKKNLGTYSGGMKQRFGIAQALLSNPQLIIVDEPTAGLDPAERNRFHNLLCELGESAIVILSTHIVDDVKELCSHMAIINQGKVLMQGSPQESLSKIAGSVYKKTIPRNSLQDYKECHQVISEHLFQGQLSIHVLSPVHPGNGFEPIEANLHDVYFSYLLQS